jgi:NNP family nitrate/nitrite transporter-like MFS transporter
MAGASQAKLPIKPSDPVRGVRALGRHFFFGTRRLEQLMHIQERSILTVATAEGRALWMSTVAFTACFAVWTIFSIIGIRIKDELGLSEAEFGLLVGTPILAGSLARIFLGIWTDRYGGRLLFTLNMLAASAATALLVFAHTYPQMLLAALGVGLAGGSFALGVAYVSRFFPPGRQGTALGIFGAGNVGAAVTKFVAPFALVAWGWHAVALIWAGALAVMAIVFWFTTSDDPVVVERRRTGVAPKAIVTEFAPLKDVRVWRLSLYYFFTFGAFVALALWLPRYLIGVYGFDIETAGMIGAAYTIPASIFRAYGGVLSDRIGARSVLYWCFAVSAIATLVLSLPAADYVMHGTHGAIAAHFEIRPPVFVGISFVLGFFMSIGKAAVYKHVATYYPDDVGSVGGLVGMIGGLGGFVLPIAFGFLNQTTGLWTSCFMLLFVIVMGLLLWMHVSIRLIERSAQNMIADEHSRATA